MKNRSAYRHTSPQPLFRRACALVLALSTAFTPTLSSATALFPGLIGRTVMPFVPPSGTLPVLDTIKYDSGKQLTDASVETNGATMTINQNKGKDKVIIDWSSFNIGNNATVRFYQGTGTPGTADWKPNSNYATLNRIYDLNPSVINGNLTADGRVYLINRNGVFFGPQGNVQVQSLVASAFKMSPDDFKSGLLRFGDPKDPEQPAVDATISNEGKIETYYGGSVFLIGPKVQNLGTISARSGKIDLVGLLPNGQVQIQEILKARNTDKDVTFTDPSQAIGDVVNLKGGKLYSDDGGWIGLYGNKVQNDGVIRAVTSRSKNGIIYLLAKEQVTTGVGSETSVDVSDSSEAMGRIAQSFTPGTITFGGLPGASPLTNIDHEGKIIAHSGVVAMEAVGQVTLGAQSSIDVSGLELTRPMSDQFIEVQLNSLNLRDDYGQKNNKLILGSKVWMDVLKGSNVGNQSGDYLGMLKNARDLSTAGGTISIGASTSLLDPTTGRLYSLNNVNISKGAEFNLSGGKVIYSGSAPAPAKLIGADGRVYDISSAPKWMTYTGILGQTVKSYGKFGSELLNGISFGGHLLGLRSNPADRVVGGSAGMLSLSAGMIEGLNDDLKLKADVATGINQTVTTTHLATGSGMATVNPDEYQKYLNYVISQNRGVEAPTGGKLVIGSELTTLVNSESAVKENAGVGSIAIKSTVTGNSAAQGITEISAVMINRAKLSLLEMYANTLITTDNDANITLNSGGSYIARGRRIEFLGSITAPGGSVELVTRPNITSNTTDIHETIYLGSNSRISTAGEQIDNSRLGLSLLDMRKGGFTSGGTISLLQLSAKTVDSSLTNNENSIVVSQGALLDVSGGYLVNEKGAVSGGNAGTLKLQAHTISLGGDLKGFSLPGKDGGEVILHAQEVQVVQGQGKQLAAGFGINDTFTDGFQAGKLVLGADRFKDTGFSRISLNSNDNLTVDNGVVLTPSLVKSTQPGTIKSGGATCIAGACFSTAYPNPQDQIGKTSIALNAGKNVYGSLFYDSKLQIIPDNTSAKLTISNGATVAAADGGAITLTAPFIDIAGTVRARGGSVSATASLGDLVVEKTGWIDAKGYNKTGIATKPDQPAPLPVAQAGGTVTLEATATKLILEGGARVDVSGSEREEGVVRDAHGMLTPVAVAGDAGSLTLAYGGGMTLDGTIAGAGGKVAGARNGSLTVKNTNGALTLNENEVQRYQDNGFDALTFSSPTQITIPANLNLSVGRSLTLRSQRIQGTGIGGDAASISAPWITLNGIVTDAVPTASTDTSNMGTIGIHGTYLDLQGGLLMEGFNKVKLQADRDLTVAESYYTDKNDLNEGWRGYLKTNAADLTLQANRIYTTTAIDFSKPIARNFTITSPSNYAITTPGKVTTLPGAAANQDLTPIYSAGGNLTITADKGIDHYSFIAVPQGSITLDGGTSGRVELHKDSVLTTAGSGPVPYGAYDGSKWWSKYVISNNTGAEITSAPSRSISLNGNDVVVNNGAIQDLSGGGSVYAGIWQPGIPGSKNPLTVSGRYVILPDGSATRPGQSVYLEAMPSLGLKAGVYSILPIEYAFVPGALVIQDTGQQLLAGQHTVSTERYPVVGGYMTVRDMPQMASQLRKGFSIRRAGDVLKEGDFSDQKSFSNGDGGSFTFNATGNVAKFDGTLKLDPQAGYKPGNAAFVAKNVEVVESVDPNSNALQLDGNKLTGLKIGELRLGDAKTTDVTVQKLSNKDGLTADNIILSAGTPDTPGTPGIVGNVTLQDGAQVNAANGYASVTTPNGIFTLGDNAKLTAKNGGIKLDVTKTALSAGGTIDAGEGGNFSLTSNNIKFDDAPLDASENYFHLTKSLEENFNKTTYKSFTIASRGEIDFRRGVDLTTASLTIDAARYVANTTDAVNFTATDLTLLNSAATKTSALSNTGGSLGFTADNITIAPRLNGTNGNIAFDKFGTVNINSKNDLVFKGAGTIAAGGDLKLSAARVTTSGDRYKSDGSYTTADIKIDGRNGAVVLNGSQSGGIAGTSSTPGGNLQILGNTISQNGGILDVAAGQIGLTAINDIAINGTIKAMGSEQTVAQSGEKVYYNGGKITLQSDGGKVDLKSGASLDVSAAAVTDKDGKIVTDANGATVRKGDAGAIVLSAITAGKGVSIKKDVIENGVVKVKGAQLAGTAGSGGKGGSFDIDSASASAVTGLDGVGGLNGLSGTLASGGFDERITIRSRAGDLELTNGNTLTGREVVVAADGGDIAIGTISNSVPSTGHIVADTADGSGTIELYAGKKLTIENGATLSAMGKDPGANGGTVILSSQDGFDNENINNAKTFVNGDYALNVYGGINVSGNGGTGGTVAFRAYQGKKQTGDTSLNDVNIGSLGTITGASKVSVEAVSAYTKVANIGATTANVGAITGYNKFMSDAAAAATKTRLFTTNNPDQYEITQKVLQAGIEISSEKGKNLTVDQALDLKNVRPGGEAIVLTLKSSNDLAINANLADAPTAIGTLHSSTMTQNSTAFNLVAGSDGGANYMGVVKGSALNDLAGTGDLTVKKGTFIYSENAPIRFAAGKDAIFNGTTTGPNTMINGDMKYNLGSYGGSVRGDVGRDLKLEAVGSAIQTALGNIDIRTGRDINLGTNANTGAIRTTGEYNSGTTGKTEIAPGLNEFLALPELAGLLNPKYTPTNGENIINPDYKNPFNLGTNGIDKTLQDLAALIYANGGSNKDAANVTVTASSYWTYHNGGSIRLDAGRSVAGNLKTDNGWDGAYIDSKYFLKAPKFSDKLTPWYLTAGFGGSKERKDSTSYNANNIPVTVGIATMGGGNVSVSAGGSLQTQVGAFGTGDVAVTTGGDMSGRFRIMDGSARLTSGGGFGTVVNPVVTELAAAQVLVAAMGDVHLGTVQNPDNTRDHIFFGLNNQKLWNMTYSQNSSFSASSLSGNATLYGTNPYYGYSAYSGDGWLQGLYRREFILPASFTLAAVGDLYVKKQFFLAPSHSGNLGLFAGGSIRGTADMLSGFTMQDVNIDSMYGRQPESATEHYGKLSGDVHDGINHLGDKETVKVSAGMDIDTLILKLNKPAEVLAGGDINKLKFVGQNLIPDSLTSIQAGGSIDQGITIAPRNPIDDTLQSTTPTIELGGPGTLLVQAGKNIRLGNSGGINSVGNINNNSFGGSGKDTDSDLIVVAGANSGASMAKADVQSLFAAIRDASDLISPLKVAGKTDEVNRLLAELGPTIRKYFYTYTYDKNDKPVYPNTGNLDLVDSAISSRSGSIYAMAGGAINVGKTALSNAPMTTSGITTLYGGDLSVYAGGDINVNESRLMTYYGGDIAIWSDQGSINAGRGSKTVVSAPTPVYITDKDTNVVLSTSFTPPSAGSGIRALTFDVDGSGPGAAPEAGSIHVYTPKTLDAGEAGIQGGKLLIAASTVLNSQNITAGAGSVGVPASNQSSISIGPMTGATDVTSDKKMIETISGGGGSAKNTVLAEAEDFLMKYLDVKVVDLANGTL